jgi:hypothetical protein
MQQPRETKPSSQSKRLLILRGAPGAGKSTAARALEMQQISEGKTCGVCSADSYFIDELTGKYTFNAGGLGSAHAFCLDTCMAFMESETDLIIIDNTNIMPREYEKYLHGAAKRGYGVEQWLLRGKFESIHNVPAEIVECKRAALKVDRFIVEYKGPQTKICEEMDTVAVVWARKAREICKQSQPKPAATAGAPQQRYAAAARPLVLGEEKPQVVLPPFGQGGKRYGLLAAPLMQESDMSPTRTNISDPKH